MRRKLPLLLGATFLAFSVVACEGPAGPQGDRGPAGEVGPTGPTGPAGTNALNTCSDCHSSDATIVAIEQQFDMSPHGFGNFEVRGPDYAGGACAACHTSQGFVAAQTGEAADWTGGAASMNCRTCHEIHTTFEGDDYALTATDPVEIRLTGNTVDFPGVGGNLCTDCHQGRIAATWPSADAPMTQDFTITSSHFGPHYSPQANVYAGEIGQTFGTVSGENAFFGPHDEIGCTGCHMALGHTGFTPTPSGPAGHSFQPTTVVCADCHDADFNYGGVQTEVSSTLVALGDCLEAEGIVEIHSTALGNILADHGGLDDIEYHPVPGTYPEPFVAAYVVWAALLEDGSYGVHQPRYAPSLAANTLAFMEANSTLCPVVTAQ